MQQRETWQSQLGFIAATSGAAIGLGQIWKFPYMVGIHGGSPFVFWYVLFLFFFAVPAFTGEIVLGRLGRASVTTSLRVLTQRWHASPHWVWGGRLALLTLFLILGFYNVVASWSLVFLFRSAGPDDLLTVFPNLLASPLAMALTYVAYCAACFWWVARGLQHGVERACRLMMPLLAFTLGALALQSTSLEGFSQAVNFLFADPWHTLPSVGILEAAGHSLFSLATGAGCALAYGSHLPERGIRLGRATVAISLANLTVALTAALAIFSVLFTENLPPGEGPLLMYRVLPQAFLNLPYGSLWATGFFFALFLAAFTSSLSLAAPLVDALQEHRNMSRPVACAVVGLSNAIVGGVCISSFNLLAQWRVAGFDLFTLLADVICSSLLCLGALFFSIFASWIVPRSAFMAALEHSELHPPNRAATRTYALVHFLLRYALPPLTLLLIAHLVRSQI